MKRTKALEVLSDIALGLFVLAVIVLGGVVGRFMYELIIFLMAFIPRLTT